MFLPETPQDIESVELKSHRRYLSTVLLITGMSTFVTLLFTVAGGGLFWLGIGVFFILVGGLNVYLMDSRPTPRYLGLDSTGIRFETKQGNRREYPWSEVVRVQEHLVALRGRHRMEIFFKDGSETLSLYAHAMFLTTCDGKPADGLVTDRIVMSGQIWDRHMKYVRVILDKNIPSFKA